MDYHQQISFFLSLSLFLPALDHRLHEFDQQVTAVREGMARVVPVPLLSLFTGYELETMVCGSPDIPIALLKSVATYKGMGCLGRLLVCCFGWVVGLNGLLNLIWMVGYLAQLNLVFGR